MGSWIARARARVAGVVSANFEAQGRGDSPKTLAAFALGLTLFVITLLLNIVALRVVKKYREAYE